MKDIVYQEPNVSNDKLDSLIYFLNYFGSFTIIVFVTIIVSLEIVSYRIQSISDKILCLYEKIDQAYSAQFAEKYRFFIHVLYCSKKFRGVKANKYLQHYKIKTSLENIEEVNTLCYLEESIGFEIRQNTSLDSSASKDKATIKKGFLFSFLYK